MPRAHNETVAVGLDREVRASRSWWYLSEWVGDALPLRPDGKPVIRRRVVEHNGEAMIPELMVASSVGQGATYWAWFDRWWHSKWRRETYSGVDDNGETCLPPEIAEVLGTVFEANGSMDGVWDAVAVRADGSVSFTEVKRRGTDQIRPTQHRFASIATEVLGERVSFAVVEWTAAPPLDWHELGYRSEREYLEVRQNHLSDAEYISRDYRWTMWDEDLATWVRNRMPHSGELWLRRHHLLLPRQHDRFFASMDALRLGHSGSF